MPANLSRLICAGQQAGEWNCPKSCGGWGMGILEAVYSSSSNRSPESFVWADKPRRDHRKSINNLLCRRARISAPAGQRHGPQRRRAFNVAIRTKPVRNRTTGQRCGHDLTRGHKPAAAIHTLARGFFHNPLLRSLNSRSFASTYAAIASRPNWLRFMSMARQTREARRMSLVEVRNFMLAVSAITYVPDCSTMSLNQSTTIFKKSLDLCSTLWHK